MNEQWKPVRGWANYEVSTLGRVRRVAWVSQRGRLFRERILKARKTSGGYQRVDLFDGDKRWSPLLHTITPKGVAFHDTPSIPS